MTYPHDRYPDILSERHNSELEQLVGQLDALGQQFTKLPMPPAHDARIVRTLRGHALANRRTNSSARRRGVSVLRRALLFAAAALTAIAVLTGATVVLGISAFPWNYAILQQFGQLPQSQDVNLAQSACGYTLRVSRVYADANVFIVGYTVTDPDEKAIEAGLLRPRVSDASGVTLPESDYGGVANLGGTVQYQAFDTGDIPGQPSALKLHMAVPAIVLLREQPVPSSCSDHDASQLEASPTPSVDESGADATMVRGPFVFDMKVAYQRGRELRPHLAVTEHARTLTLERIVSTPLETRFYVSGSAENAYPTLAVGGHTLDAGSWGPNSEGDLIVYRFEGSPYNDHGQWTLTIHAQDPIAALSGEQPLPAGTWSFTFALP